ncbi:ABC transporter substrate-binding protein [Microbacterium sp. 18062]|uniref:ABC transporter substrate-binding protein n=1 Tax=Microbacterium sp. 18062 TaxID=2681410 RepID=UPI001359A5D4|nr:ABC transporter substrate-binding protein [Microbacterium sp. 18062]
MIPKRAASTGAILMLAVLGLSACGQQAETPSEAGDVSVSFSNIAETQTLDPAIAFSSDGLEFVRNVYDSLTAYDVGGVTIGPSIASEWEMNDDATEYTFTLEEGITFHDGTGLTADDVVSSIERVKAINQGPATLITGIESVTASDDLTVVVSLSAPDVYLPGRLQKIAIVSGDAVEENATTEDPWATDWFAANEAGSGPYVLDEWNRGTAIELSAFEDYRLPWEDGAPTRVTLRTDPDVQTALQLMQQGEIDMMGAVGPDDSMAASAMDGVKLVEQSALSVKVLPLNTANEALQDVRVREAITLAFDYEAFDEYYQGFAQTAVGPLPSGFGGGLEDLAPKERDVERATQLLEEAGYGDGLSLTFMGISGLSYEEFAATLLEQNLGEIGIDLELNMVPWPQMVEIQSNPESAADITFLDMSAVSDDPSAMLAQSYLSTNIAPNGGYNWSYYQNPEVDAAIQALSSITDEGERQQAVLDTVDLINSEFLAIYGTQPSLAQPVLDTWKVAYEPMDYNYVVRFFYARSTGS